MDASRADTDSKKPIPELIFRAAGACQAATSVNDIADAWDTFNADIKEHKLDDNERMRFGTRRLAPIDSIQGPFSALNGNEDDEKVIAFGDGSMAEVVLGDAAESLSSTEFTAPTPALELSVVRFPYKTVTFVPNSGSLYEVNSREGEQQCIKLLVDADEDVVLLPIRENNVLRFMSAFTFSGFSKLFTELDSVVHPRPEDGSDAGAEDDKMNITVFGLTR